MRSDLDDADGLNLSQRPTEPRNVPGPEHAADPQRRDTRIANDDLVLVHPIDARHGIGKRIVVEGDKPVLPGQRLVDVRGGYDRDLSGLGIELLPNRIFE